MSGLPVDDIEALANENIGEALRITRIHYSKTLDDVEDALRIRSCQIIAIEQGDISNLPGKVYAIGFVRSYAEYLGIDGARAVQLFKDQYMSDDNDSDSDSKKKEEAFSVLASETKKPAAWIVALSVFLVMLLFIAVSNSNKSKNSDGFYVESVPEHIKTHVYEEILIDPPFLIDSTLPDNDIAVENMSSGDEQKAGIILNIIKSSWVEIKNSDGKIIVSNILEAGEQYFVPNSPGLSMSLGNAANVEIIIDGKALKPLGKDGDVRRDIPLNTAYLKTLEFKDIEEKI